MSPWSKLAAGLFFCLLGLGYLCKPTLVERVISFLRDGILNDAHIALDRRKWGTFFLLLSVLFLYMAYTAFYRIP